MNKVQNYSRGDRFSISSSLTLLKYGTDKLSLERERATSHKKVITQLYSQSHSERFQCLMNEIYFHLQTDCIMEKDDEFRERR